MRTILKLNEQFPLRLPSDRYELFINRVSPYRSELLFCEVHRRSNDPDKGSGYDALGEGFMSAQFTLADTSSTIEDTEPSPRSVDELLVGQNFDPRTAENPRHHRWSQD